MAEAKFRDGTAPLDPVVPTCEFTDDSAIPIGVGVG